MKASAISKLSLICALAAPGAEAATVNFGGEDAAGTATVIAGENVLLSSLIAFASAETDGLFSYGLTLIYEGPDPSKVEFIGVRAAPELDFDGVKGDGAFVRTAPTFAGIKGTVDLGATPFQGFLGPQLAEFELNFPDPGEYVLRGDFFNTLGPTEAIFVDTGANVLDQDLIFGTFTYTVIVPEPSTAFYLLAAMALILSRKRPAIST